MILPWFSWEPGRPSICESTFIQALPLSCCWNDVILSFEGHPVYSVFSHWLPHSSKIKVATYLGISSETSSPNQSRTPSEENRMSHPVNIDTCSTLNIDVGTNSIRAWVLPIAITVNLSVIGSDESLGMVLPYQYGPENWSSLDRVRRFSITRPSTRHRQPNNVQTARLNPNMVTFREYSNRYVVLLGRDLVMSRGEE